MLARETAPLARRIAALVVACLGATAAAEPCEGTCGSTASQSTGVSLLSTSGFISRTDSESTLVESLGISYAVTDAVSVSLRYGATQYRVHRSREDAYKLDQMVWFESKVDFARYWDSPEMNAWRARNSGRFQVPVLYAWNDEIAADAVTLQTPSAA